MTKMSNNYILVEDNNGVRNITFNRPDAMNALNYDVIQELENALHESRYDDNVRVIVLKGSGRAFCAGDDLKGMDTENQSLPDHDIRRAELGYGRLILSLRKLDKPVIAQVHGYALGAGCDLALASDLVFAAEDTKFGLVFSQRGLVAGTVLLPKLVSYQKACQYLFTGELFTTEEAVNLGMVNEVFKAEYLSTEVEKFAEKLAKAPTAAIGLIKKAINDSIGSSLEQSVDFQSYVIAASYNTHDYHEGKQAFVEKREPQYLGK